MIRSIAIILALTMAFAVNVAAAAQQQHIRGTIQSFDQNSLTIASRSGDTVKLLLGDGTKYAYVVKSDLSEISSGSYIGTATTKVHGMPVAIEVVVFPESMAGTGEGHYPWDKLRNTTMSSGTVSSNMTNATVKSTMAMDQQAMGQQGIGQQKMVSTDMTNATVKTSKKTERGTRLLTVAYNGEQMQILVPPTAPIVAFEPQDGSILKQGAHVFIVAAQSDDGLSAKFVAVGKNGLNPPM